MFYRENIESFQKLYGQLKAFNKFLWTEEKFSRSEILFKSLQKLEKFKNLNCLKVFKNYFFPLTKACIFTKEKQFCMKVIQKPNFSRFLLTRPFSCHQFQTGSPSHQQPSNNKTPSKNHDTRNNDISTPTKAIISLPDPIPNATDKINHCIAPPQPRRGKTKGSTCWDERREDKEMS